MGLLVVSWLRFSLERPIQADDDVDGNADICGLVVSQKNDFNKSSASVLERFT